MKVPVMVHAPEIGPAVNVEPEMRMAPQFALLLVAPEKPKPVAAAIEQLEVPPLGTGLVQLKVPPPELTPVTV